MITCFIKREGCSFFLCEMLKTNLRGRKELKKTFKVMKEMQDDKHKMKK